MPNVTAGSILIAQSVGSWVNEQNWELTGTVGVGDVPAPNQLYLGASASSTPNYYVDYFITYAGMTSVYNSRVTAYNSTTKIATVSWQAADASPAVGTQWKAYVLFPVLSAYQWQKNGVDIQGEIGRAYTTTAADIGATISFYTQGGTLPAGSNPDAKANPTSTTVNQGSQTYTVTGPTPSGNFVNSSADFTLLGAFRLTQQYTGVALAIVPASKSPSGQKCIYVSHAASFARNASYNTIPTLTQNYSTNWAGFPSGSISQIITSQTDVFNGLWGTGVQDAGATAGAHIVDSSYLITSYVSTYSSQQMSVMARRPANLATTSPVDLFVLYDPLQPNARWRSGAVSEIPTQYRAVLGGDLLVAGAGVSIHSNLSQGPCSFVFDSSTITSALTKATSGTSVSGTTTTMVLAVGANTTTVDYYKDCYLVVGGQNERITAYDNTTRRVTVANAVLPTTTSAYTILPSVTGKQLIGYGTSSAPAFFASDAYGAIWDLNGVSSSVTSGFVVNNTKSWVCQITLSYGQYDYGISVGALPSNFGGGSRLYNPYAQSGPGDQNSHFYFKSTPSLSFVTYSTDDMATVASGAASFTSLTPKAVFSLQVPYDTVQIYYAQFDNTDGKLYVMIDLGIDYTYPIVLVYQCNKWSA